MRIGISVLTHAGQNVWENGLGQNVIFLAQVFRQLPFVKSVLLLNCGDQADMPPQVDLQGLGLKMIPVANAADQIDVAVEMAGAFDSKWLDYIRALGKKVVWYCAGQPYVGLIEPVVFGKPGFFSHAQRMDQIWALSKDYASFAPMLRALHRCPVYEVPYLWSPMFLRQRVKDVEKEGLVFGYQARVPNEMGQKTGLRVAIFEPNISVVKTASIPMLVCDQAYRTDPTSVNFMHALNTLHMVEHPTMLYLANSLNLVQDKKAVFPGRHDFVGYMVQHADAVISHQWANDQNYLYLDALYGNYPLIHNSPWLRDAGYSSYYYPDFDTHSGAKQLLAAAANHDAQLAHCKEQASEVIASVNPIASINLQGYAQLLLRLFNGNQSSGYSA